MTALDEDVRAFLRRSRLAGDADEIILEPLVGGVSSDIWRAAIGSKNVCVKRALARLRVARLWEAPVTRNASEWAWLTVASKLLPGSTPSLYAHDPTAGFIAMEYLPQTRYANWKTLLRDGEVSLSTAAKVGETLGRIHSATAGRPDIAEAFANDEAFLALRIKPYLLDCALLHPHLSPQLRHLADITASTKMALVHGDVSPKNILVGPDAPCFIDAECAWYGDPTFDLAFVLNHLLLKAVWRPQHAAAYRKAFTELEHAYMSHVSWEPPREFEARCARLLPALTLARIDGTSPVEYITDERERDMIRRWAASMIQSPRARLKDVAQHWASTVISVS